MKKCLKRILYILILLLFNACGIHGFQSGKSELNNNKLISQQVFSNPSNLKINSLDLKADKFYAKCEIHSQPFLKSEEVNQDKIFYHNSVSINKKGLPSSHISQRMPQKIVLNQISSSGKASQPYKIHPLYIKDFIWSITFLFLGILFLKSAYIFEFLTIGIVFPFLAVSFYFLLAFLIFLVIGIVHIFRLKNDEIYIENQNDIGTNNVSHTKRYIGLLVLAVLSLIIGLICLYLATISFSVFALVCMYIGLSLIIIGTVAMAKYVIKKIYGELKFKK